MKHTTCIYGKSVSYAGLQLYNMIPLHIRNLNLNDYEIRIKTFLLNNPFYDIDEFYFCDNSLM
jgi:hypothetical protein